MNNFVLSQIAGILVCIASTISLQVKNMRHVLLLQLVCNTMGAASFILVGGLSGCGIYIVAILQTVIYFIFNSQKKQPPKFLAYVFAAAFLACSVATYKSPVDLFSAAAALTCAFALAQSKSSGYRILILLNGCLWMAYAVCVGAYTMILSDAITAVSAAVGILRLDLKRK